MRVALTFDTEPPQQNGTEYSGEAILDALKDAGAVATFFLQGQWIEQYPHLAKRIRDEGHLVGNHTYSHVLMGNASKRKARADIQLNEGLIRAQLGADPRPYFRCPQSSGAFSPKTLIMLEDLGYKQFFWTADSFDWQQEATSQDVYSTVMRAMWAQAADPVVILMHSWAEGTNNAIERILRDGTALGAEFATL